MEAAQVLNSPLYTWGLLPLLIFLARVLDVTLGTIRLIFVSRGMRHLAPLVGFFEILIWLLAMGQIFRNLNNIACYLAYAVGFAAGNFLGLYIVDKLALSKVLVRIITAKHATRLVEFLKGENYGVTTVDAEGSEGAVKVIFSVIKRDDLERVVEIVKRFNPHAFYSIEDVRFASEGIFRQRKPVLSLDNLELLRPHRKSK